MRGDAHPVASQEGDALGQVLSSSPDLLTTLEVATEEAKSGGQLSYHQSSHHNPRVTVLKGRILPADPFCMATEPPDRGLERAVHVLVVDDNSEILEILSELLEESGYRVTCCSGGLQALLSIGRLLPDVMLLDLKLDDISGFDVYRAVRADPAVADLPILFVSGVYLDQEMICSRLGDETARLLLKPIPGELLISEIERAIESRRKAA